MQEVISVILFDIMTSVVSAMEVKNPLNTDELLVLNFQFGRQVQIINSLIEKDDGSDETKGTKYPLIAIFTPVYEDFNTEYYCKVKIPRLVISTITSKGTGDASVAERYESSNTFKTILYPLYYELLKQLSINENIVGGDPDSFNHRKFDDPGTQPISQGSSDFIDSIEIHNLEITLIQIKTC